MPTDNKTIQISIKLWTDEIAETKGQVDPKHAWDFGVVTLPVNTRHDIKSSDPVTFNSWAELPAAIEKLLVREGVRLHKGRKSQKLFVS